MVSMLTVKVLESIFLSLKRDGAPNVVILGRFGGFVPDDIPRGCKATVAEEEGRSRKEKKKFIGKKMDAEHKF
jgi:hypothetical protein